MADIDRTDLKILRALADDGRLSWRDLAQKIGLSLTPTLRRVRRLEEEQYIQGYFARLDEERLSGAMSVFVSVTLEKQTGDYLARFEENIVQAPQVMSCFQMTGDADYMLRVVVKDLAAYQAFLTTTLTQIPGVAGIKSAFALKSVLKRAAPPI
ncbi:MULTISPECIES: Lrp/AsnC family transcriptional regulator [Pseudomonas]|uniref:Lrp/AsnC family transcriptional regulator n=1 Tax=Pseudomonas TaxID=286 RepID=UPI000D6FFBB8|nr:MULTISPECIES: Lrp/AsnC family transcriptional regulator [unclassified Pseudomonas]MED5607107.1 Lrp/AsnC family transcriptional regulator [Pseudomonas sp. JH-2]PWU31384.1 ArsR family transcriptional regulator [Pseudomonas sp. RW407]